MIGWARLRPSLMRSGLPRRMTLASLMYGPGDLPTEQINNSTGTVEYVHHDQQGSTQLLTGGTGKTEVKSSNSAYGMQICEGSATTPLEYDGQYTSSDTGLIYMR